MISVWAIAFSGRSTKRKRNAVNQKENDNCHAAGTRAKLTENCSIKKTIFRDSLFYGI